MNVTGPRAIHTSADLPWPEAPSSPGLRLTMDQILEDLQDGVFAYDAESLQVIYMNAAARRRFDWTAAEVPRKTIFDTAPTFAEASFRRHVAPLMSGELDVVHIEVLHSTGALEISTRLRVDAGGRQVFLSVLRDLSWRKSLESRKIKSMATASHELRSPLTSIHGALKILASGQVGALQGQAASLVDMAVRNSDRLLSIIADYLDIEKIDSGSMDFSLSPVDLVAIAQEAVDLLGGMALDYGVTVRLDGPPPPLTVMSNRDRLLQVLINFVSNAIKHSPRDQDVCLCIAREADAIRVSVIDKGPGIQPDDRRKLFKAFANIAPSDGVRRTGTGLGLALVGSILQRLGYHSEVRSEVGKGAEFAFFIPKSRLKE